MRGGSPPPGPPGSVRWRELWADTVARLGSTAEARWMVEEASGGAFPGVLDELVTARAAARLDAGVARRRAGEPLQYVLGRWGFRGLDLLVDQRVLIPRPETEGVVDVALAELGRSHTARGGRSAPLVVDLGTGSGAIALSIAAEHPGVLVWATDASGHALDVARANLAGLGGAAAARVRLLGGSWWDALPSELRGCVDVVVSNPPYVTTAEMGTLPDEVARWEPHLALEAGPGGLEAVAEILAGAPAWLRRDGAAVIELAPHQGERAVALARRAGFGEVDVRTDLTGRQRTLVARLGGPVDTAPT